MAATAVTKKNSESFTSAHQEFGVTDHPQSGWLEFYRIRRENTKARSALTGAGGTGCKAPDLKSPN
jgi:hypothetical protein